MRMPEAIVLFKTGLCNHRRYPWLCQWLFYLHVPYINKNFA